MKKSLQLLCSLLLLGVGLKGHAQGLTCATASPVTRQVPLRQAP